MNHLFIELQAKEKIEKYRSEGTNSQAVSRSLASRKSPIRSLLQAISVFFIRRQPITKKNKIADNPELKRRLA
jgi:hypothetical protein